MLVLAEMRNGLGKSPAAWLLEPWVFRALGKMDHTPRLKPANELAKKGELCTKCLERR